MYVQIYVSARILLLRRSSDLDRALTGPPTAYADRRGSDRPPEEDANAPLKADEAALLDQLRAGPSPLLKAAE
jgi:hypothetical protein